MGKRAGKRAGRRLLAGLGALCLLALATGGPEPALPVDGVLPEGMEAAPTPTPAQGGLLALTFDDGPRRSTTTALLDGLAERGVKATFFLVGGRVANGMEDLVERMDAEGHQIGIHTYDHVALTGLNRADFDAQVGRTRRLLTGILGHDGFALRPPYGQIDAGVRANAGSPLILWSVDPEDWDTDDAQKVARHLVSHSRDGDILLLHDIFPSSVEAALLAVDQLHQRGFYFVTVDELLAQRHIQPEPGKSYRCAYP